MRSMRSIESAQNRPAVAIRILRSTNVILHRSQNDIS